MIKPQLAQAFGIAENAIPQNKIEDLSRLASQTSLEERESLYALTRYVYTGEGDVWDIGCAAGGSSYCLAAGIQDNESIAEARTVKCFDLFGGYSSHVFKGQFAPGLSDLDIFNTQTNPVRDFVKAEQMDLVTDLDHYAIARPIEIAHIDAAKSLALWQSIFKKLSAAIIPNKTIWIYQDFERARLPWQVYSLAAMMPYGQIIGGATYGTLYFKFNLEIDPALREKIIENRFSLAEQLDNVRSVFNTIRSEHMDFFPERKIKLSDLENTVLAYCYYWSNKKEQAQETLKNTSAEFLSFPGHEIYTQEIC